MDNKTLVLICSCDKFEDAWEICGESLKRYWEDCPYEVALLTERRTIPSDCFFTRALHVSSTNWAEMLHEALDGMLYEYIIFMLEDQWPIKKISQAAIESAVEIMSKDKSIGIVYLESSKVGGLRQAKVINEEYNEIPFGAPYRLACAPGIFRKDYLYEMTNRKMSPWDFERVLSYDERGEKVRVLELKNSNWTRIDQTGAIFRGKWVLGVNRYAQKMGVHLDLNKRPEQTKVDFIKRKIKDMIFNINPKLILKIQNIVIKGRGDQT